MMSLEQVLPAVQELTRGDKMHLVRILIDELDETRDSVVAESSGVYPLYTPYNMFGVADLLMEAFEKAEADMDTAE